jgi:hypothetical protein
MDKPLRIRVFGKAGCDKCSVLKDRLDRLLATEPWQDFDQEYCDVETIDGIVALCEAECVNPQQIPAMLVMRRDGDSGRYEPVPNPQPGRKDPVCKSARLHQHLGLRTDYSGEGGGVISPKMIAAVLQEARA